MNHSRHRGYTLVEILIALSIGILALFGITSAIISLTNATTNSRQHQREYTTANQLTAALTKSADSSTAMFIPLQDVLGNSNADGHALGFMAKGHADTPYFWQFVYDAAAQTVTEYDYTNFSVPAAVAHGTPFVGVTAFSASRITADQLTDPFLQGYQPVSYELDTGFAGVKMGNTVYAVSLQVGPQQQRSAHLLPSTTVSGFNLVLVHAGPTPTDPPIPTPAPTPPSAGMVLVAVGIPKFMGVVGTGQVRYIGCTVIHIWVPASKAGDYTSLCPADGEGGGGGGGAGPPP